MLYSACKDHVSLSVVTFNIQFGFSFSCFPAAASDRQFTALTAATVETG